ncbi:MAG TPA: hypothetical protein VD811_16135, partial [Desulfuromonadales bacterium]|nr:hypothetical protein [Desulfuromonadales bacterium]
MSDSGKTAPGALRSLFDKSYKILFIIYAPIALAIYLYQFVTGVKTDAVFLLSGVCAAISFILGVAIVSLAVIRRRELFALDPAGFPFLLRPRFLLYYLPVLLLSFGVSTGYLIGKPGIHATALGKTYRHQDSTNIAILINARDPYNQLLTTSLDTMQGFGLFILYHPEQLTRYNFEFFDHQNRYDQDLQDYIRAEIEAGTRYFVCLSSEVCEPLSQNFAQFASLAGKREESPILITTVAAATG